MRKGVKAGNAGGSKIFQVLLKSGGDRMPPPPNAGFTTAQISLVAKWINEGAKNTTGCNVTKCDTTTVTYSQSVAPIINTACLGCHSNALASGGYNFSTHAGLKAAVTNGRLMGSINSWSNTSTKFIIDFGIHPIMSELNDDWQIVSFSNNNIQLKDDNPLQDDQLHLSL